MSKDLGSLYEFIERAKRDRKYAENTAFGRKAALQLYELELSEDEKKSIDLIYERLDRISQAVFSKNSKKFSSSTLAVYKRRVKNLIDDYRKFGTSAEGMAAWSTNRKTRTQNKSTAEAMGSNPVTLEEALMVPARPAPIFTNSTSTHDLNVQLRPDLRLTLSLPYDLAPKEASRLKLLIDSMTVDE